MIFNWYPKPLGLGVGVETPCDCQHDWMQLTDRLVTFDAYVFNCATCKRQRVVHGVQLYQLTSEEKP